MLYTTINHDLSIYSFLLVKNISWIFVFFCFSFLLKQKKSTKKYKEATNIFAQAGKCNIPCIDLACDTEPEHDTKAPSRMVKVYPRKIDLQNTEKLKSFELSTVVNSVNNLKKILNKI